MQQVPEDIWIFHICHVDRLLWIMLDGNIWSNYHASVKKCHGTNIGAIDLKNQRLNKKLFTYPELHVGECANFYFCPRSPMLYLISRRNSDRIDYLGGQGPVVHLAARLTNVTQWASDNNRKWVFTPKNATKSYRDYCNLDDLDKIDWYKVFAVEWKYCKEEKMAEFLMEKSFPWELIDFIGVHNEETRKKIESVFNLLANKHHPRVEIRKDWYYQ